VRGNPQVNAVALLVRKFGRKIPGGGYEVEVSRDEMMRMSPHGTIHEVSVEPNVVKWQYFPNPTIEGEGGFTPEGVTPISVTGTPAIEE
jgi:KaiC/GvpD/RAD55 family RecA-like ATPase